MFHHIDHRRRVKSEDGMNVMAEWKSWEAERAELMCLEAKRNIVYF